MAATLAAARHRLPTGGRRIDVQSEQSEHAVANELIGLATGVDDGLRGRAEEAINQEYDVERQSRFGQLGRAAHVDEHADDVALLADVDAAAIADKIGADMRGKHGDDSNIGVGPQLAGQPDCRIGTSADAGEHKRLAPGRPRQRATIADNADTAGGASRPPAAHAGVRHVEAQARFEDAQALRHAHLTVGIGDGNHAAPAFPQRAQAARGKHQTDEADIADRKIK